MHAAVQADSAPDSPPTSSTVMVSTWQTNQVAVKIERYFGATRLRDTAVSMISNIAYSGNSPS
jgi:hypothetical protein